jgi:hypothetical protein
MHLMIENHTIFEFNNISCNSSGRNKHQ